MTGQLIKKAWIDYKCVCVCVCVCDVPPHLKAKEMYGAWVESQGYITA